MKDRIGIPFKCPKCNGNDWAIFVDADSPGLGLLLTCTHGCDVAREIDVEAISEWGTLSGVCIPISQAEYQAELVRIKRGST